MANGREEITFSYSIENDREFQAAIDRSIRQIGSLKTPFKLISRDFYKSQTMFKLKGPGQYPDFKTEDSRQAKERDCGFDYPLLVRTGKLMRSMTSPDDGDSVNIISDTELIIGTTAEHGLYHQSDSPRNKIPLRKFLFIGPEAVRFATNEQMGRMHRWTSIIREHVNKKLGIV